MIRHTVIALHRLSDQPSGCFELAPLKKQTFGKLGNPRGLAMEVMAAGSLKIGYPQILWLMTLMCPIQWPFKRVHCIFRQTHDPCRNAGFFSHGPDGFFSQDIWNFNASKGNCRCDGCNKEDEHMLPVSHNGLPTSWPTHVGLCGEKWKTYGLFEHCSTPTNMH